MPSQILVDLTTEVSNITTVAASATALINGISARIATAIKEALANGATAEELAPVQTLNDALKESSAKLSEAVEAHTVPSDPPPTDPSAKRR